MKPYRPDSFTLEDLVITRINNEEVNIKFTDPSYYGYHIKIGPDLESMSDKDIYRYVLDFFKKLDAKAAEYEHVAIEIKEGHPQMEYSEECGAWSPVGDVLKCHIMGCNEDENDPFVMIDEKELTLEEFGKLLSVYSGWGMRVVFVPGDELEKKPLIEVRKKGRD